MTLDVRLVPEVPADAEAVAVPVFADRMAAAPEPSFLAGCGFSGKPGETQLLPPARPDGPARVVVGMGPSGPLDAVALRRMAAVVARTARRYQRVALPVADLDADVGACLGPAEVAAALVEGFRLGVYRFTRYRAKSEPTAAGRLDVVLPGADDGTPALIARAGRLADAVILARDLGNEPGGELTPAVLAERAEAMAAAQGLRCEVWDRARIEAERLGGLLGVNRGSTQPPRLVTLGHEPDDPQGTVALVGKGVTFDSGGLTIKTLPLMFDMKLDMAGAAAVLGAMSVLRDLACPVRVLAFLPLTDNMSGGDATRIGDVLRTRNGTTVEVLNADAEGRLLLADALALAAEARPEAIVDLATLTDTVPMAVGRRYAGLTGNHPGWQDQVAAAAARAGELLWPMPPTDLDRRRLDSRVADLANVGHYRYGQSTLAALFLRQFVPDDVPWAHIDMAGPAVSEDDDGLWSSGATGFGVRTLVELVRSYRPPGTD